MPLHSGGTSLIISLLVQRDGVIPMRSSMYKKYTDLQSRDRAHRDHGMHNNLWFEAIPLFTLMGKRMAWQR